MASSVNRFILIGAAVSIVGVAGYFIYINLTEDSPSGQLARSRIGLEKSPGAGILQDPSVRKYKPSELAGGYRNRSSILIDSPYISQATKDILKKIEQEKADQYYGKANADFIVPTFSSKQVDR
jgi:hypothetical protein